MRPRLDDEPGNWDEVLSDDEAAKKTVWPTRVDWSTFQTLFRR